MSDYEHRSLFLHVTRAEAEVSIVASLKYLVNHFFEMYGIEVGMVLYKSHNWDTHFLPG